MAALQVLIVDDDPWVLRMVATVLDARGCQVHTAKDGHDGFTKALQIHPDLIVTDVMMPEMDGWSLVRSLRARSEFSLVPVIFLTALGSDDDRLRGFRLGADDYLPKPFRFEEFDLRVGNALRKRQEVLDTAASVRAARPQPGVGIQGTLEQLGLPTLLAMIDMERKSGVLVLHRDGITGRILSREGVVVSATIDGGGLEGPETVYWMLGWTKGTFEFTAAQVDVADTIHMTINHLLLEGARRLDEARPGR